VHKPSIKGAFYAVSVKTFNKTSRTIRKQFGDMSDPTTIPLMRGDTVYGPSSTNVNIKPSSSGGGKPVSRPPQFDIIGNAPKTDNRINSDHQSCSVDSMTGATQYQPDVGVGSDHYSNNNSNYRPTWNANGLNPFFSRLKRTKRVNKYYKKNRTYCI